MHKLHHVLFLSLVNIISSDDSYNFIESNLIINILIEFVTFLLFSPNISSFYIFSCVIYGLAIVSKSMSPKTKTIRKKIFKFMIYTNVFITVLLLFMAVVLITDITNFSNMFHSTKLTIFECIYLLLVLITLISANYFAFGAMRVIHASIQMIRVEYQHKFESRSVKIKSRSIDTNTNMTLRTHTLSVFDHSSEPSQSVSKEIQQSKKDDSNVNNHDIKKFEHEMNKEIFKRYIAQQRMLISTIVLSLVLLAEILSLIACLIKPQLIHPIMQLSQIFLNLVYLVATLKTYHYYIKSRTDSQ